NMLTIRRRPRAPLVAVDRAEVAVCVCPFVPDRDLVLVQPRNVRVAAQKPQQLVDDRAQVNFLRRQQRKASAEIEAQLMAEDAARGGAGASRFYGAVVAAGADERGAL